MVNFPEGRIELDFPYSNEWNYGHVYMGNRGRRVITLIKSDKARKTISYARYVLACKVGRFLTEDEDADHVNDDRLDDRSENLQILSKKANRQKSVAGPKTVLVTCFHCGEKFLKKKKYMKDSTKHFCNRQCLGKHKATTK